MILIYTVRVASLSYIQVKVKLNVILNVGVGSS